MSKSHQKGQALILIVFAMVGLIGIAALAVDGGNAMSDKRHAQSAADTAALAAALAKTHGQNWSAAGQSLAASNGYTNDGVYSTVTVNSPPTTNDCDPGDGASPYIGNGQYVMVVIHSTVDTFFAPVVGVTQVSSCVEAIALARPTQMIQLFGGAAVVGLAPNGNSFDSGASNSAKWTLHGGGIFANYNANSKNGNSVTFDSGKCVAVVHGISGFTCSPITISSSLGINYPSGVIPLLPPIPPCTGTATFSGGQYHEQVGYEGLGSKVDGWPGDYAPGLYCIYNIDGNIHDEVTGTGVTFYIMDSAFTVKFNGGGYVGATAPTSGTYAGMLLFSNLTSTPCTQNLEYRGNGTTLSQGTIFLPSACIDFRGNADGELQRTQVIGYRVTSNGNAGIAISYYDADNYDYPDPPRLELVR